MPYANNNGVKIHYEVEGKGPALILQHGSASNPEAWRLTSYTEELSKDYRLILVDARGCGKSDKPHDAAQYSVAKYVGDFVAILNDLKIAKANYLGNNV